MSRLRWNWKLAPGQSIMFLAIILFILIAFTGLAIDTGRAFQRQRTIQAAANAGAISGMNMAVKDSSHNEVSIAIKNAMMANGIKDLQQVNDYNWGANPDTTYYSAEFLDANGDFIAWVTNGSDPAGDNVAYVRVTTSEGVSTSFSKAVGQEKFQVSADGIAGQAICVQGVLPITFHENYINGVRPLHSSYWNTSSAELLTPPYQQSVFTVARDPEVGNFLFLSWLNNNASNQELGVSLGWPGNFGGGFVEATPPPGDTTANQQINQKFELGDWMGGTPGNMANNTGVFQWYVDNKQPFILPLHDQIVGSGNNRAYRSSQFITVRLLEYSFTPAQQSHMTFALLDPSPICVTQEPGSPPQPPQNNLTVTINEELRWYDPGVPGVNYNIAMVMDYSGSMTRCWASDDECGPGSRRVDYQIPAARDFVNEILVNRNNSGADNQMAMVKFNGSSASTVIPFTDDETQFWSKIGSPGTPVNIPNSELTGTTPTAHGLNAAVAQLNASRKTDKNGKPVKLIVVLLTDGLSNVFFDAPYSGQVNSESGPFGAKTKPHQRGPEWYPCVKGSTALDSPYYQSTCPTDKSVPSPIFAAIEQANIGRESGMVFYAVALAQPNNAGISDLYLDRIADKAFLANSQAAIDQALDSIAQDLNIPCDEFKDPPIPALGATATLYTQSGSVYRTATLNADGQATFQNVAPGSYSIGVSHSVASANDPNAVVRNYNRLLPVGVTEPIQTAPFVMPTTNYDLAPMLLVLGNYADAQCPPAGPN